MVLTAPAPPCRATPPAADTALLSPRICHCPVGWGGTQSGDRKRGTHCMLQRPACRGALLWCWGKEGPAD